MKRTAFGIVAGILGVSTMLPVCAQAATTQYVETVQGWVSYHSQPGLHSPVDGRLHLNQKARLVTTANRWWYEVSINGRNEYITTNSRYTKVVGGSAGTSTPTPTDSAPAPTPVSNPAPASAADWQAQADKVIAVAKTQLGDPYYWGHQVPRGSVPAGQPYGFDCSNFVAWSYKTALGIHFTGSSVGQRYNVGTPVPLSQIREGDLLFFATSHNSTGGGHVGLYMGNGMVIQEGGGWGKVTIEPLQGTWLGRNLVFARRVIQG